MSYNLRLWIHGLIYMHPLGTGDPLRLYWVNAGVGPMKHDALVCGLPSEVSSSEAYVEGSTLKKYPEVKNKFLTGNELDSYRCYGIQGKDLWIEGDTSSSRLDYHYSTGHITHIGSVARPGSPYGTLPGIDVHPYAGSAFYARLLLTEGRVSTHLVWNQSSEGDPTYHRYRFGASSYDYVAMSVMVQRENCVGPQLLKARPLATAGAASVLPDGRPD